MSLLQVLEAGGYDLTKKEDATWFLGVRSEFEDLVAEAEETMDQE